MVPHDHILRRIDRLLNLGERRAALASHCRPQGEAARGAERRLERLAERTEREPALERALELRIPERQLDIDRSGPGRNIGMDR